MSEIVSVLVWLLALPLVGIAFLWALGLLVLLLSPRWRK